MYFSKMKPLLLVLLLTVVIVVQVNGFSTKFNADVAKKWINVGVKATDLGKNQEMSVIISFIDVLGATIPYGSAVATLITGITSIFHKPEPEIKIILDQFTEMNRKFDHIDFRLTEISHQIDSTAVLMEYQRKRNSVNQLKNEYNRFSTNPTQKTHDDFKNKCANATTMLDIAHWIDDQINSRDSTTLNMHRIMTQKYDMQTLKDWSTELSLLMSTTMYLHITCLGASNYTVDVIERTLHGADGNGGDSMIFDKILKSFKRGLNKAVKEIKTGYAPHARGEVEEFMRTHTGMANDDFSQALIDRLAKKYYWRRWIVASWNGDTNGYSEHTFTTTHYNIWAWKREHNRCLFIGSVLPAQDNFNSFFSHLNECTDKAWRAYNGENLYSQKPSNNEFTAAIYHYLQMCFNSLNVNVGGLAVVRFGNTLRSVQNVPFFKNIEHNSGSVSVIAVPYDGTEKNPSWDFCIHGIYCNAGSHCCPTADIKTHDNGYFCNADEYGC